MNFGKIEVELLDWMGTDLRVANAARVSFAKETETFSDKEDRLIKYLADHGHWTPFAHCQLSFRIKAPIFVARQAGKHQIGLVWNETSRRYVSDEPEFFWPDKWRLRPDNIKQGSSETDFVTSLPYATINAWSEALGHYVEVEMSAMELSEGLLQIYNQSVEKQIAPEQARMILPQNMMTEWWWTGSLYAFARICKLRLKKDAQKEIRDLAQAMALPIKEFFPISWKHLMKGVVEDEQ